MNQKVFRVIQAFRNIIAYKYSTVQCNLPDDIAKKIIDWGRQNIPDEEIHINPHDSSSGREDHIHVTVLYGIHGRDFTDIRPLIASQSPFKLTLDNVSIFDTSDEYDVVKLNVKSPDLHKLNKIILDNIECTNTFPKYLPHITVAYVKKGMGAKYAGRGDFKGFEVPIDAVEYSGHDNYKTTINLIPK